MKSYADLINSQTFEFPTESFNVNDNALEFHGIPLREVINAYGTPLKLTYMPKITENVSKARQWFADAFRKHQYTGKYIYCYCTKASHFGFVLNRVLENGCQLETSSVFDLQIIQHLYSKGKIDKTTLIICNGFKTPVYTAYINKLINEGFENCIPILDNLNELDAYTRHITRDFQVGIIVETDKEPIFAFYTSRLGIGYREINRLYTDQIKGSNARLKLLHFFINTGIKDSPYYWSELSRFVDKYCELSKICPELDTINIGGGFPIKTSLDFSFDYASMVEQIVGNIRRICDENDVPLPNIITEFGAFTVGESGAIIYSVVDQKLQNDKELWYMIDGSFINNLPDIWGLDQQFITLPINKWGHPFGNVSMGGLTCDSMDYYNAEKHLSELFMPLVKENEKLYVGFFHTGAYQEALGGYGGFQHCLIPAPKHILIDKNEKGAWLTTTFTEAQTHEQMLQILGY